MNCFELRPPYKLPFNQQGLSSVSESRHSEEKLPMIASSISQSHKFHNHSEKTKSQKKSSLSLYTIQRNNKIINYQKRPKYNSGNIHKTESADNNKVEAKKKRYKFHNFYYEIQHLSKFSHQNPNQKLNQIPEDFLKSVAIYTPLLPRRHLRKHLTESQPPKKANITTDQQNQQQPTITRTYTLPIQTKVESRQRKFSIEAHHIQIGKIKKQVLDTYSNKTKVNRTIIQRKIHKVFNSILFTIYLQRYWKRMKQMKQRYVMRLSHFQIGQQLLQLKKFFIQGFGKFKAIIAYNYDINLNFTEKDSPQLKQKKKILVINLVENAIEDITRSIKEMIENRYVVELIYHICMNGSYSCGWKIHTKQELNTMCLSSVEGYIRSDKYLQKSAIISFMFMNIIVFNILLCPNHLKFNIDGNIDRSTLFINVKLIGNILYELLRKIQEEVLAKCDKTYKIGNWKHLIHKFRLFILQSMTITKGIYSQNQLISGLIDRDYLNKVYHINEMKQQMMRLFKSVSILHDQMVIIHKKLRKRYY